MEKLGGPAYIPNPLTSPALMVLASTAEAARSSSPSTTPLNDYHAIYSSPSSRYLDGDAVHRMVLSSGSYQHRAPHFALYPGAEHYPERVPQDFGPHYLQIHHHLSSSMLHKANGPPAVFNGTGAFRRVGVSEHGFPFYPVHHQRSLLERERLLGGGDLVFKNSEHSSESNSIEPVNRERSSPRRRERGDSVDADLNLRKSCSPQNDESNAKFEVKKEVEEEMLKCCDEESGTSEDVDNVDRSSQLKKKRRTSSQPPGCPICGITIRLGEMDSHFAWEMERVHEENRKVRRSQRETAARKNVQTPPGAKRLKQEGRNPIPNDDTPASTRHQTYLRVCANRMTRNGRSTLKSTRSRSSQSSPLPQDRDAKEGPSGVKLVVCPVCGETICGPGEELNAHVEACLQKRGSETEENSGDTPDTGEFLEYEWAGQTRIRATALMEGGFRASGFQTALKRNREDEDDADLNIDGDDAEEYGKPQYTEVDLIPCNSDEPEENQARQALRGAVLSGENSPISKNSLTRNRWSDDEKEQVSEEADEDTEGGKTEGTADGDLVMSSLKSRIKELEKKKSAKIKCLICMEPYSMPLVSISCWHVHCEECWLRSLGVKKLCPQCNVITSSSDLRRIYL